MSGLKKPDPKRMKLDPVADKKHGFSKFKHAEYPSIKYDVKHPTKITANADFLIKGHDPDSEIPWIVPVHKQLIIQAVPYFTSMYNEKSKWREQTEENSITLFDAPKEYSAFKNVGQTSRLPPFGQFEVFGRHSSVEFSAKKSKFSKLSSGSFY